MDNKYVERKLKWFDEHPEKTQEKENFLAMLEKKSINISKEGPKEQTSGAKKVTLVLTSSDKEAEELFLKIKTPKDVILEVIKLKEAVDRGYSINTFPSVVYEYNAKVIKVDNAVERKVILDNITNLFKDAEEKEKNIDDAKDVDGSKKDNNDQNQLNWGGQRSSSSLKTHVLGTSPMFFRRNGMSVDLVNLYEGKSIFLICNGPSMNDIDLSVLKKPGITTFGINNGGHLIRPNFWTCVDDPTRFMRSIWEDPTITKIVPQAHFEKSLFDDKEDKVIDRLVGDCPNVYGFRRNEKFIADDFFFESTINWGNHKDHGGGRSVMISSLRLCHLLGFKNVYLVGCDFQMSETKKYFFNEERKKGAINNNNDSYKKMTQMFKELKPIMDNLGFNVYNTNRNSKLDVFDFVDLDDAIKQNEIDVSGDTHGMYVDPKTKRR